MAVTLVDGKPVAAPGQIQVITPARGHDPRGRRAGAEGGDRHGRVRRRRRRGDRHAPADQRHARRLRRGRRQEARRAAVRHAAAVPVARLRAGGRRRAAAAREVRRPGGLHPPGGLHRQRPGQGPPRSRCRSSTCRPSRGCSSSARTAGSPRGSRARSASTPSSRRSRPRCEHDARGSPSLAAAAAALGRSPRRPPRRTGSSSAPTCRSRSGCSAGRRRSCSSPRSPRSPCCGRRRGCRSPAGGRCRPGSDACSAAAPGRVAVRADRRRAARGRSCWPATSGEGSALDNLAPTFILIDFWVGLVFVSVLFGDVFRAFSPWRAIRLPGLPALPGVAGAATRRRSRCSPSPGSSSCRAGASIPRR